VKKTRINVSLDPELLEKFDRQVVSDKRKRSKEIARLMEKALDVHRSEDPELKRKIQKFRNMKEERKQTKDEVSQEIKQLDEKISMYEQKLEERKETDNRLDEAVDALGNRLKEKRQARGCSSWSDALTRLCSEEPYWDWVDRLDVEPEKLKDRLKSEYVSQEKQEVRSQ
jgi:metal-responsive CopG/Arc/MetJ family transcriptional regulator